MTSVIAVSSLGHEPSDIKAILCQDLEMAKTSTELHEEQKHQEQNCLDQERINRKCWELKHQQCEHDHLEHEHLEHKHVECDRLEKEHLEHVDSNLCLFGICSKRRKEA